MSYPIVEIFTSIQGEGCNLGLPANFIRFAGCNLNCKWCDTEWDKATLGMLTIEQIVEQLDRDVRLVVLTGGEPLIQKDLDKLIKVLTYNGFSVAIETNGTIPTMALQRKFAGLWISCSPKPETNWSIADGCICDELKYVIDNDIDAANIRLTAVPVWLQPEGSDMQESWKKALRIQRERFDKFGSSEMRIGVQLHKIMEVR